MDFAALPSKPWSERKIQLLLALHIAHARCVTIVPPAVVQLGLAGLAGALGAICVYPIDLVKTRLQSTAGGTSYDNAFEVDEMMTKEGGLPALYKGIRPQLVGVVPEKTIKLFVHDAVVLACGEAASGFLAGCCQVVVTNPLEVVKVRMQLSPDGGLRVSDVVSELGLRGLCTGAARTTSLSPRPQPSPWSSALTFALTLSCRTLRRGRVRGARRHLQRDPFPLLRRRAHRARAARARRRWPPPHAHPCTHRPCHAPATPLHTLARPGICTL